MIDSVPLIQNANDAQQINASIIAMKKASRELDEKIVKLNSLNSELDKKIALLDSGLNKEIEDRKEAINSLDVPSVGGSGKYISAISETDGKISATASDITSSVSSGNSQPVTSGGVAEKILISNNDTPDSFPNENVIKTYRVRNYNIGWLNNDGLIIDIPWSNIYGWQIALDDESEWGAIRVKNNNTWGSWKKIVLDPSNLLINIISNNVTLTISANTGISGNFTFTVPSGYKVVGFNGYITSGPAGAINMYSINMNNIYGKTGTFTVQIFFRNYTSTQQTAAIQVFLLCVRV